jgi:hypothetical protein
VINEGNCTGLHPYGPCKPDQGCNTPVPDLDADPIQWILDQLALARARVAALEAVAEAARAALDVDPTSRAGAEAHIRLEAALDAAAGTTSGERDL